MLITMSPYFWGYSLNKIHPNFENKKVFSGFILGVEDGNSYIAKSLRAAYGEWLFRTPYTDESQKGVIAYIPYILIGKLVSGDAAHEQMIALFHIFRFGSGFIAILATFEFLRCFINHCLLIKIGTLLSTLGGGLGWIFIVLGKPTIFDSLPLEFYSPEAFGFLSLFTLPHMSLSRALLLWGLIVYIKAFTQNNDKELLCSIKVGIIWLSIALIQPITSLIFGIVLFSHLGICLIHNLVEKKSLIDAVGDNWVKQFLFISRAALISMPFIIYYIIVFNTDPFLIAWTSQNLILSPHFIHYFLAYGIVFTISLFFLPQLLNKETWKRQLLIAWVIIFPILVYAPIEIQRRMSDGVWVVLVTLSMIAIENHSWLYKNMKKIVTFLITVSLPSTFIIFFGSFLALNNYLYPLFIPKYEVSAYRYLAKHATLGDIVVSSYKTGNNLPAWAVVNVFYAHGPESIYFEEKQQQIFTFFNSNEIDFDRKKWLYDNKVRFIYWGPFEKELGDWNPESVDYLIKIYHSTEIKIYETIFIQ